VTERGRSRPAIPADCGPWGVLAASRSGSARACYRGPMEPGPPVTRDPTGGRRGRGWRALVAVAVLGAVWWPARPGGRDGFPLSSYPMFGYARAPTSSVDTVLGVSPGGLRFPLSPNAIAGVSQPKLALERVHTAIARKQARALCRDVARRVATSPALAQAVALEVVTDAWDTLAGLEPGAAPLERVVHERCEVPR
jgi:hypothetical protein